ncbi:apoptosis inhibitor 5 homolog [Scaptodrosophila lebanonensis]|uniref:Apoptosis inhibitor 5 homolog n=1 Tax=Drosophila lebanonensis TaxID=7225 RepID=A0A6J2U333_DROLE|nr:apoptosis inhibitor 5 homolog [Scaptodrosophila lebanonensis]
MDNIERLYKCYELLSEAGDKITEHVEEYKEILQAVKGTSKEKRLASQFIGNFFKYFPDLADTAIDAIFDLCEDDDTQIRRQAIKDLPKLCQGNADATVRVGDTLAQLLVLDDPAELQQVNNSLQAIIKLDTKSAVTGLFQQITTGDEPTRERCFKFIATKLLTMGPTLITKEIEDFIVDEIKKALQDVTADEFHLCMTILGATKLGTTVTGHAELVKLATEQAELNSAEADSVVIDEETVERFIQCATAAAPYFSKTIKSTQFVTYVCDKLLPTNAWHIIASSVSQDQIQLRLLKVFAEMVPNIDKLENASERIDAVYNVLLEYMPLPKLNEEDLGDSPPSFQFSHAECLLYALHTLGKKHPNNLSFVEDAEKLKDFRSRLQYLARGTQGYIKKLEEALKGKKGEELKTEENQLKQTALKTTSNINQLIRDLFHSPPIFKHDIVLSWVVPKDKLGKRHAPISFGDKNAATNGNKDQDEKKQRPSNDQKFYSPPSGKYSAKVNQGYGNNRTRARYSGGGGGGGGGGNFRNRRFNRY